MRRIERILECSMQGKDLGIDAGPEFGSDEGAVMIVKKALYGLKSSGFSWKKMLTQNLMDMGYKSTIVDPDMFIRPAVKADGCKYNELLLTYVDDCLCVSANPQDTMDTLGRIYDLKDTVKPPERYLGANILRMATTGWTNSMVIVGKGLREECRQYLQGLTTR
jgi:Reverse transcriptase (RNA-dependent DNA polymerase)